MRKLFCLHDRIYPERPNLHQSGTRKFKNPTHQKRVVELAGRRERGRRRCVSRACLSSVHWVRAKELRVAPRGGAMKMSARVLESCWLEKSSLSDRLDPHLRLVFQYQGWNAQSRCLERLNTQPTTSDWGVCPVQTTAHPARAPSTLQVLTTTIRLWLHPGNQKGAMAFLQR